MQTGEVGIEITPILAASSLESRLAAQLDALLRRTSQIARALTGAEQAALKLWVGEDPAQARRRLGPVCARSRTLLTGGVRCQAHQLLDPAPTAAADASR
jgi:hypothetical protein